MCDQTPRHKTMRIGIIGTGVMGRNHLRVVDSIPELRLSAAMDINRDNLETACAPYHVKQFKNHRLMAEEVDAVMVSTPTESHFEIGEFFLNMGKHVLIEKPISMSLEEADELIRIADDRKLTLAVGHLERFNPAVQYINSFIDKPLFIEIQRLGSFSSRSLDVDVILDLMIHDIDLILQWDRSPLRQINASGIPIVSNKIDIANVRLEFDSRLVVNMTASRVSQKKTRKLRIFQRNNYFSIDYNKQRVKKFSLKGGNILEEVPEIPPVEPLYNLWMNFYRSITTGKNLNVTGAESRSALKVAKQIVDKIDTQIDL